MSATFLGPQSLHRCVFSCKPWPFPAQRGQQVVFSAGLTIICGFCTLSLAPFGILLPWRRFASNAWSPPILQTISQLLHYGSQVFSLPFTASTAEISQIWVGNHAEVGTEDSGAEGNAALPGCLNYSAIGESKQSRLEEITEYRNLL